MQVSKDEGWGVFGISRFKGDSDMLIRQKRESVLVKAAGHICLDCYKQRE